MKVSAHNGANPAWSPSHQATGHTSTAQKITINPEVENYRVVSGTYSHEIEFLEQVLDYSTSVPLRQRSVSKVVFDKNHYLQAHSYVSQGQSLNERLSREGVEIILMEDIAAFIETQYPKILVTLEVLEKLYSSDEIDSHRNTLQREMSEFYADMISFFLPEYAFSSGNNEHLKIVTVTRNNFFGSLFSRADADSDTPTAGMFIEGVRGEVVDQVPYPSFIFEEQSINGLFDKWILAPIHRNGFSLFVFPHHLWVKSHHLAKELARVANQVVTQYLDQQFLLSTNDIQLIKNDVDSAFSVVEFSETLAATMNSKNAENTAICHESVQFWPEEKTRVHCWASDTFNSYADLRFSLNSILGAEYQIPGYKMPVRDRGGQHAEYSSQKSAETVNPLAETSNVMWLLRPRRPPSGNSAAGIACFTFTNYTPPDGPGSIGTNYLLETSCWTDGDPRPPCVPIIKLSDARRLTSSADCVRELRKFNEEILGLRARQQTRRFCYSCKPLQSHKSPASPPLALPHGNNYAIFSIAGGAVAPVSALAPGLFLGMTAGFAGHIHRDAVTQHPVACALACATSSAVGYCTMGLFGVGLSLGAWVCQSWLPREWAKVQSTPICRVAQSLLTLPMLIDGIYPFAIGITGFALGNYCTSAMAGKVLNARSGEGEKQQRSAPTERRKKKRLKAIKMPAQAAQEAARRHEKDAASTETFADTSHQDDAVVFRRRMIHSMLASSDALPWSLPDIDIDIELLVMAYARNIEDRQERADYLEQRLTECEKATDGLLFAASRFPDLFGQYLQAHQGNDIRRAKALWTVLTPASSQELLVLAGKMLVQDCLNNDHPTEALATLDDPRLTGDAALGIINDLSGAEVLFRDGAPEKLARAYLARVNLKERKQKTPNHVRDAVTRWLRQRTKKPELTDNLLHLAMDFHPADTHDEQTRVLIRDFRDALRNQAEVEARYLPDTKNKVQRYLRAGAVKIALNESYQ